jgi:hypothetical protein
MVTATICCKCGPVPLSSVSWVETGETLTKYRSRLRSYSPSWLMLLWPLFALAGAGCGLFYGFTHGLPQGRLVGLATAGLGAGLFAGFLLIPFVYRAVAKFDPRNVD